MASIVVATDLHEDPYVVKELPKLLGGAGHFMEVASPLEQLVKAARLNSLGLGGIDLGILVHGTATMKGTDSPFRVAHLLRTLPNNLSFRNAVKAKALPLLVIAKKSDLGEVEKDKLAGLGWAAVYDPESATGSIIDAVRNIIYSWRTDLLHDLECAGYAVTIAPGGILSVKPAFVKADVEGEILSPATTLAKLSSSGYLVLSSDYFRVASAYRQFAYLIENYRIIAKAKKTKPEEVFQEFFANNQDMLFTHDVGHVWPKPRFHLPEDPSNWLEPDFVVKPSVIAQLGTKWRILDIKLPDVKLVGGKRFHPTFSSKLNKAIQQLADYRHYFGRPDAKATIEKILGFQPRNPRLAVLIGRKPTGDVASILDHVGNTMPQLNVDIITYDEVLEWRSLRVEHELEWLKRFA